MFVISFQLLSAADASTTDMSRLHDKLDRKIKVIFQRKAEKKRGGGAVVLLCQLNFLGQMHKNQVDF